MSITDLYNYHQHTMPHPTNNRTLCAINSAKKNKKLKERELANYKIAKLLLPDDIINSLCEFQFG